MSEFFWHLFEALDLAQENSTEIPEVVWIAGLVQK